MKCAKCGYLGFETGDRCRNCGFDFSLLADAPTTRTTTPAAGPGRSEVSAGAAQSPLATPDAPEWLAALDRTVGSTGQTPAARPLDVHGFLDRSLPDADGPDAVALDPPRPVPPTPVDLLPRAAAPAQQAPDAVAADEPDSADGDGPTIAGIGDGLGFDAPPAARNDVLGDLSMKTPAVPMASVARVAVAAAGGGRSPALPLFGPIDDEPPAQLRAEPRPPIAVRRTPEAARVRALAREIMPPPEAPALQFADPDEASAVATVEVPAAIGPQAATPSRRLLAAGVDVAALAALSGAIVALTLRMLDLPVSAWQALPLGPMGGFLVLLVFAYLCTFVAVGGQTIGKMVAGVRVVTTDGCAPGLATAVRRAAASLVSAAIVGLGFVPALLGRRLALHDRLAGTRVVDVPPA
jgi:uncharacterized RDD family membrane protein YckC